MKKTVEVLSCIGCGQSSKGTLHSANKKQLAEMRKSRDAVFESVGWRKVPGGWKCNNCTGIKGITSRWES